MPVGLRHLRSFVAVAEEGNIGRAARRLFITQPALSRQVQQLEREVGVPLLVRTARGVELTDDGRELLARARVAIDAAEDALSVGRRDEPRGRVLLGLPMAGPRERWFALARAFMERHPAVELEVREAISEHLQRQVLTGELDAALTLVPARLPGLHYAHVRDEPVAVFANREHRLASRPGVALDELEGEQVVLVGGNAGQGSGFNAAIRSLFAAAGVRPQYTDTREVVPARAGHRPDFLGVTVALDFPPEVVRIALVPARTLPFELVRREDSDRPAVHALAAFAAEFLATWDEPCAERMPLAGSALDGREHRA